MKKFNFCLSSSHNEKQKLSHTTTTTITRRIIKNDFNRKQKDSDFDKNQVSPPPLYIGYNPKRNLWLTSNKHHRKAKWKQPLLAAKPPPLSKTTTTYKETLKSIFNDIKKIHTLRYMPLLWQSLTASSMAADIEVTIKTLMMYGNKFTIYQIVDRNFFEQANLLKFLGKSETLLGGFFSLIDLLSKTLQINDVLKFIVPNIDLWYLEDMKVNLYGFIHESAITFSPEVYLKIETMIKKFFEPSKNESIDKWSQEPSPGGRRRYVSRFWLMAVSFVMYAIIESVVITPKGPLKPTEIEKKHMLNSYFVMFNSRLKFIMNNLTHGGLSKYVYDTRYNLLMASLRIFGGNLSIHGRIKSVLNIDVIISNIQKLIFLERKQSLAERSLFVLLQNAKQSFLDAKWNFENPAWFSFWNLESDNTIRSLSRSELITAGLKYSDLSVDEVILGKMAASRKKKLHLKTNREKAISKWLAIQNEAMHQRLIELALESVLNIHLSSFQKQLLSRSQYSSESAATINPQVYINMAEEYRDHHHYSNVTKKVFTNFSKLEQVKFIRISRSIMYRLGLNYHRLLEHEKQVLTLKIIVPGRGQQTIRVFTKKDYKLILRILPQSIVEKSAAIKIGGLLRHRNLLDIIQKKMRPLRPGEVVGLTNLLNKKKRYNLSDKKIEELAMQWKKTPHFTKQDILTLVTKLDISNEESYSYIRETTLLVSVENRRRLIWNLAIAMVHMARGGTFSVLLKKNSSKKRGFNDLLGIDWNSAFELHGEQIGYFSYVEPDSYKIPRQFTMKEDIKLFVPVFKTSYRKKYYYPSSSSNKQKEDNHSLPTDEAWLLIKPNNISEKDWLKNKTEKNMQEDNSSSSRSKLWSNIKEKSKKSLTLTAWQKTIVAFVAIFLTNADDEASFYENHSIMWTKFEDAFVVAAAAAD